MPNERLVELLDQKQMERLGLRNGNSQKVVSMEELEKYILQGWEYVKDTNGSKAIIKLPVRRAPSREDEGQSSRQFTLRR
jgi:hypothetical protein